jgi:putative sporulation protein YtxC
MLTIVTIPDEKLVEGLLILLPSSTVETKETKLVITINSEYISVLPVLSQLLLAHIFKVWRPIFIRKAVNTYIKDSFSQDEIADLAYKIAMDVNSLPLFADKFIFSEVIKEYLCFNEQLNIQGFIQFSLPGFLRDIKFDVELAIEQFQQKTEYREFVNLLKYFTETSPVKYERVYLVNKADTYDVLDINRQSIVNASLTNFYEGEETELADLIISTMMVANPYYLIIDNIDIEDSYLLDLLRDIFADRIFDIDKEPPINGKILGGTLVKKDKSYLKLVK